LSDYDVSSEGIFGLGGVFFVFIFFCCFILIIIGGNYI